MNYPQVSFSFRVLKTFSSKWKKLEGKKYVIFFWTISLFLISLPSRMQSHDSFDIMTDGNSVKKSVFGIINIQFSYILLLVDINFELVIWSQISFIFCTNSPCEIKFISLSFWLCQFCRIIHLSIFYSITHCMMFELI